MVIRWRSVSVEWRTANRSKMADASNPSNPLRTRIYSHTTIMFVKISPPSDRSRCVFELHDWDENKLWSLSKTHTKKFNDIAADFSSLLKVENTFKQKPAEAQSELLTQVDSVVRNAVRKKEQHVPQSAMQRRWENKKHELVERGTVELQPHIWTVRNQYLQNSCSRFRQTDGEDRVKAPPLFYLLGK